MSNIFATIHKIGLNLDEMVIFRDLGGINYHKRTFLMMITPVNLKKFVDLSLHGSRGLILIVQGTKIFY